MILYQDADWLAVDKPCGLATHGGHPGELGAVEWLALHQDLETFVVSRLDVATSGVLWLARHREASGRAQRVHEEGLALKTYEFLSAIDARQSGLPDSWTRDDPLDERPAHTLFQRRAEPGPGGLTRYTAVITRGRRHQVRRHAALSGVPILGDADYGGEPAGRLYLHCAEVRWPGVAEPVCAPLPPSFALARGADAMARDEALCRDRRGDWPASVADCWRAVHRGEIAGLDAAVDAYGPWLRAVCWDESLAADESVERLSPLLEMIGARLGTRGAVVRGHRQNPHQEALPGFTRTLGEPPPERLVVVEHGLRYGVDLAGAPHPGLFLDQRDTRRRVARVAAGRRVANLFAFTCSFSVVAAANDAEVVFSVDTARGCLRDGADNFALNGLVERGCGKFIQEDARRWLGRQERARLAKPEAFRPLDLVVCDPPVFSSVKEGGRFSVSREWSALAGAVAALLSPTGVALFANNHRGGDHTRYRDELRERFPVVDDLRPPLDFPLLPDQPRDVRAFWCRAGADS
ncbi:MAG: class I SAM-dependent methyltransferase [bacterium]|nr:class I SAM-dependent methyltransferase [bacterium]